jgi:thiosulfate/3-mercaptopyruvate sulfurtransferase
MAKKVSIATVSIATIALLAFTMIIPLGSGCSYSAPPIIPKGFCFLYSAPPFMYFNRIISTNELERNLNLGNLVVLDIRSSDSYNAGHIPGAINVNDSMWYINPPFGPAVPWMEMPTAEYLFKLIGNAGITRYSLVVVVGTTSGPLTVPGLPPIALYNTATITRVAITLLYAGVKNVAILDGGYEKWAMEGKPVSTAAVTPIPVTFKGPVDETMLVSADYVESKIGKSIIVDARDEVVYNGTATEPWAPVPGHIPTARNLPAPTLWNVEVAGDFATCITYKHILTLLMMALKVVGWNWFKEIIVYCGVGGYASTVYFVLSEVLGYKNVKFFDGSAQEWYLLGKPFVT